MSAILLSGHNNRSNRSRRYAAVAAADETCFGSPKDEASAGTGGSGDGTISKPRTEPDQYSARQPQSYAYAYETGCQSQAPVQSLLQPVATRQSFGAVKSPAPSPPPHEMASTHRVPAFAGVLRDTTRVENKSFHSQQQFAQLQAPQPVTKQLVPHRKDVKGSSSISPSPHCTQFMPQPHSQAEPLRPGDWILPNFTVQPPLPPLRASSDGGVNEQLVITKLIAECDEIVSLLASPNRNAGRLFNFRSALALTDAWVERGSDAWHKAMHDLTNAPYDELRCDDRDALAHQIHTQFLNVGFWSRGRPEPIRTVLECAKKIHNAADESTVSIAERRELLDAKEMRAFKEKNGLSVVIARSSRSASFDSLASDEKNAKFGSRAESPAAATAAECLPAADCTPIGSASTSPALVSSASSGSGWSGASTPVSSPASPAAATEVKLWGESNLSLSPASAAVSAVSAVAAVSPQQKSGTGIKSLSPVLKGSAIASAMASVSANAALVKPKWLVFGHRHVCDGVHCPARNEAIMNAIVPTKSVFAAMACSRGLTCYELTTESDAYPVKYSLYTEKNRPVRVHVTFLLPPIRQNNLNEILAFPEWSLFTSRTGDGNLWPIMMRLRYASDIKQLQQSERAQIEQLTQFCYDDFNCVDPNCTRIHANIGPGQCIYQMTNHQSGAPKPESATASASASSSKALSVEKSESHAFHAVCVHWLFSALPAPLRNLFKPEWYTQKHARASAVRCSAVHCTYRHFTSLRELTPAQLWAASLQKYKAVCDAPYSDPHHSLNCRCGCRD